MNKKTNIIQQIDQMTEDFYAARDRDDKEEMKQIKIGQGELIEEAKDPILLAQETLRKLNEIGDMLGKKFKQKNN